MRERYQSAFKLSSSLPKKSENGLARWPSYRPCFSYPRVHSACI